MWRRHVCNNGTFLNDPDVFVLTDPTKRTRLARKVETLIEALDRSVYYINNLCSHQPMTDDEDGEQEGKCHDNIEDFDVGFFKRHNPRYSLRLGERSAFHIEGEDVKTTRERRTTQFKQASTVVAKYVFDRLTGQDSPDLSEDYNPVYPDYRLFSASKFRTALEDENQCDSLEKVFTWFNLFDHGRITSVIEEVHETCLKDRWILHTHWALMKAGLPNEVARGIIKVLFRKEGLRFV